VISGYDEDKDCVYLSDPMEPNPLGKGQIYSVSFTRLINSIMLGIVTYDANLLVIEPRKRKKEKEKKKTVAADAHPDSTRIFLHPLEVAAVVP